MTAGIVDWAAYLPCWRLDRKTVAAALGTHAGSGSRAVASYDEDTTSMAVEAARRLLMSARANPQVLAHATPAPPYLDKANATAIHAALALQPTAPSYDMGAAFRSSAGAWDAARAWAQAGRTALVTVADVRTGLPGSGDETDSGDAAAALLFSAADVVAEVVAEAHVSVEILDRWKTTGGRPQRRWEERFAEHVYLPLGQAAITDVLKAAEISPAELDFAIVAGAHDRATRLLTKSVGCAQEAVVDDVKAVIGNTGAAHASLLLCDVLERARPGQTILVVSIADGADAFVLRTTPGLADAQRRHSRVVPSVRDQISSGRNDLRYTSFLSWREMLDREPPRRPGPQAPAAPPSFRSGAWKFAFTASRCQRCGMRHLPPSRRCLTCGAIDQMSAEPMAHVLGTVATFTVDRLASSPSPPVVAAVINFDGGGRLACELTDVDVAEARIGMRVEMTFRKLYTADGVHNYFWKAKPLREREGEEPR